MADKKEINYKVLDIERKRILEPNEKRILYFIPSHPVTMKDCGKWGISRKYNTWEDGPTFLAGVVERNGEPSATEIMAGLEDLNNAPRNVLEEILSRGFKGGKGFDLRNVKTRVIYEGFNLFTKGKYKLRPDIATSHNQCDYNFINRRGKLVLNLHSDVNSRQGVSGGIDREGIVFALSCYFGVPEKDFELNLFGKDLDIF